MTDRPTGAIQLLVGSEVASYLPEKLEAVDNLVVLKSGFGWGYAVVGTHPGIVSNGVEFSEEVQCIRQSGIIATAKQYSNRIIVKKVYHMTS